MNATAESMGSHRGERGGTGGLAVIAARDPACPGVLIIHRMPAGPTEELRCVKRYAGHPGGCKFKVIGSATYWAGFEPRGEGA